MFKENKYLLEWNQAALHLAEQYGVEYFDAFGVTMTVNIGITIFIIMGENILIKIIIPLIFLIFNIFIEKHNRKRLKCHNSEFYSTFFCFFICGTKNFPQRKTDFEFTAKILSNSSSPTSSSGFGK